MTKKIMFPQPDKERKEWYNLNGKWKFSFDKPVYDREIEVPYSWTAPISGIGEDCYNRAFYQKKIHWNPQKERVFLCFGAVDYICTVYVNGHKMTEHIGGYDRFDIDVTEVWNRNSENEISLSVTDSNSRSKCHGKQDYGDVCGIWQTVWLEARSNAYIEEFFVRTSMDGTISYEISTANAKDGTDVTAEFGGICASGKVKDSTAVITFSIDNPLLWSPDNPYLYEGTLSVDNDVVYTYFGIREIGTGKYGVNKRNYITLNGKPLFINGVLDQSYNPQGFFTLPSDADCREDLKGGTPEENAKITLAILNGEKGNKRNAVLMNAGAALYIGGKADSLKEGIALAEEIIDSGKALDTLNRLIEVSNRPEGEV